MRLDPVDSGEYSHPRLTMGNRSPNFDDHIQPYIPQDSFSPSPKMTNCMTPKAATDPRGLDPVVELQQVLEGARPLLAQAAGDLQGLTAAGPAAYSTDFLMHPSGWLNSLLFHFSIEMVFFALFPPNVVCVWREGVRPSDPRAHTLWAYIFLTSTFESLAPGYPDPGM